LRIYLRLVAPLLVTVCLFLSGCSSVSYHLDGHSAGVLTVPQTLKVGERRLALDTPAPIPAPGGFRLGLASEDSAIVAVEITDSPSGAATYHLQARRPGRVTLHYVNRYLIPAGSAVSIAPEVLQDASLGRFQVTVLP
jgi:hypothetical protein